MEKNKKLYVKPSAAVFRMETTPLMDQSYGDGHEHGNIHIGGTDDSEWFSKENGDKVVWDDEDDDE